VNQEMTLKSEFCVEMIGFEFCMVIEIEGVLPIETISFVTSEFIGFQN
jgi:hypothetical protein